MIGWTKDVIEKLLLHKEQQKNVLHNKSASKRAFIASRLRLISDRKPISGTDIVRLSEFCPAVNYALIASSGMPEKQQLRFIVFALAGIIEEQLIKMMELEIEVKSGVNIVKISD